MRLAGNGGRAVDVFGARDAFDLDRETGMRLQRRDFIGGAVGAFSLAAVLGFGAGTASALEPADATRFVQETVDAVVALIEAPGDDAGKADEFRKILQARAAMPQIARFAAGTAWRQMSEAEQARYVDAFVAHISRIYARRFGEYRGEELRLGAASDAGKRGIRVDSRVIRPGAQPITVEWFVTDRPGRVVISDIVIEGVSLVVTQREEVGAMLEARGGSVERLIADLANGTA